jgi:hypothetical protein
MAEVQERRKHARSVQAVGTTSHHAQGRVDARVMEIMARRDAAERRASHAGAPAGGVLRHHVIGASRSSSSSA